MANPIPQKKADFEKSLARLEEVVRRLESPNLALDDNEIMALGYDS